MVYIHQESQNAMGRNQSHLVLSQKFEEKTLVEELMDENNRLTVENRKIKNESYWLNFEISKLKKKTEINK